MTLGSRDEEMARFMADAPSITDEMPVDERPCEVTCCDLQAVRHIHAAVAPAPLEVRDTR